MTEDGESTGTAAGLDSTAAMVRAESDHLDATLRALVQRLSSVPGLDMRVSYRHGKLRRLLGDLPYINDLSRRSGPVRGVAVAVDGWGYWLRSDRNVVRCGREATASDRGQVNEELSFSVWATMLFDGIAAQNLANHNSLAALRDLVEQDRVDVTRS